MLKCHLSRQIIQIDALEVQAVQANGCLKNAMRKRRGEEEERQKKKLLKSTNNAVCKKLKEKN